MQIRIKVEVDRSVRMVRPETGEFQLVITPTDAFKALPEDEKSAWLKKANADRFCYGRDGEMLFAGRDLDRYFTIAIESMRWDYKGGECTVLDVDYARWGRRV